MNKNKHSLKWHRSLRNPGEFLGERIRAVIFDRITLPLLIAVLIIIYVGLGWYRYDRPTQLAPLAISLVAIALVAFASEGIMQAWPRIRALMLGRDGEKTVGQRLETLRERGYQVFHDIPGDGFNLDHVLVGPAGVFTIETKIHSKPADGKSTVIFDGETVRVNGFAADRNPVLQGKAQASWLGDILAKSTGCKFYVKPVVVYPGWFVQNKTSWSYDIWVLNPKGLAAFLENEPARLSEKDINLASFHLSRFLRSEIRG
ncbi:MAG: NERD domain-containing protein [Deltaproteobacteria bacterium]|nr:NERD domain-containing protein [Deltaproteobacteria bacterium]